MSDPRTTPANARVAAVELQGQVEAPHFLDGETCQITAPVADLRCSEEGRTLDRQLLYGDAFRVLERREGRAFGQSDRGHYVGYVDESALGAAFAPTHVVHVRSTLAFTHPHFKDPGPVPLSIGSKVCVTAAEDRFATTHDGRFIPAQHLRALDQPETDPVEVATRLLGTPYLWGGNSAAGIDCSGLIQTALQLCGVPCPGDSDQQRAAFPGVERTEPGDLLFWDGHVAMIYDAERLIHANAFSMAVTLENRRACIARIMAKEHKDVLKIARPIKRFT
ncbi:C40 family peptidase [Pseudaestuariivita sp.]|uniref:C40 family peptidase n=1 Tax=Pseudaestuariivita sp. TaxID=2211669 RepID=UPI00405912BD